MTAQRCWGGPLDLLALHRGDPQRFPVLLESVTSGQANGRYDLLLALPGAALSLRDGTLRSDVHGLASCADFFVALDRWVDTLGNVEPIAGLPFVGGWFLLLGYEAAASVEPSLRLPPSPHTLPDALALRCPAGIVRDHASGDLRLVAETQALLAELESALMHASARPPPADIDHAPSTIAVEADPKAFVDAVGRVLDYLHAGDVFQVNLSRRWHGELPKDVDAARLYARLRRSNPAPFAGLLQWRGSALISSSPERLLAIRDGVAETRPIAGTRARLADAVMDAQQRLRLISDLKERAEHLMLIDLERNDLGRVCLPGSVEVDELMVLESYQHVHHIVSNVRGRLRPGVGAGAALRAVFPGGTITGCPKVRAMQIIAELEGEGRGPYTGAMGYLSRCGRLDSNILIRSIVCERGRYTLRTGAGIVADSRPESELAETRAKALGLLQALGTA